MVQEVGYFRGLLVVWPVESPQQGGVPAGTFYRRCVRVCPVVPATRFVMESVIQASHNGSLPLLRGGARSHGDREPIKLHWLHALDGDRLK